MNEPALDRDGHLAELSDWNESVAELLARREGITLGAEHWELIHLIRAFYATYQVAPPMRVLVKHVRETLGPEKGTSLYLMQRFPGSPARLLAKIAGLPRPTGCL